MGKCVLRSIHRVAAPLLLIGLLSSCNVARVYVGVIQARNDHTGGKFQNANRRLLSLTDFDAFAPWISYNIGTVYYALGEAAAAEEIWRTRVATRSDLLAFLKSFNLGVLAYERGAYLDAYQLFVKAVRIDPSSVEAKTNLEFAFEKIGDEDSYSAGGTESEDSDAPPGADVGRLLQYLERLERGVWQSTAHIETEGGVNDW